jgi:hypothetical protein
MVVSTTLAVTMLLVASDDDIEFCAQLLVPVNVPVNEPENDPVLICRDEDTNPLGLPVMVSHVDAAPLT